MIATVIHRHVYSTDEVVKAFGHVEDCMHREIRFEYGQLVIDIIGPGAELVDSSPLGVNCQGEDVNSSDSDKVREDPQEEPGTPAEPEKPKGGPIARRAAILCGEGAFQKYLDVGSKEEAAAELCRRCSITSRADLDHDGDAAEAWETMYAKYRLWMEGYD
ncbi:hypothetical protein GA830_10230 [Mesorhizobium sp. NBSH29]|uniref:hypothetical protein n=1 Tax=Mesorhizobium sp. NBSH29 TaxID=2654249 RepID=UPI001896922B|nr:hypothetical protein [Mesorhizobium sp. NBSH29]QPC87072.1 hypothetical protein GA830_10230 [Mesorhizobium sp. NBSH29]